MLSLAMAERKTKREKELETELEGYRNRSRAREYLEGLSKSKKGVICACLLLFIVGFSVYFYLNIKSITEDEPLDSYSYEELLKTVSGREYTIGSKGKTYLEEHLSLPGMKKKVYVSSNGNVLYLEFSNDSTSLEYPFHLDDGILKGILNEKDAVIYFSKNASKEDSSLALVIDSNEFELTY